MTPASTAATKWQRNAGLAGSSYLAGAQGTTKDQSAAAIAAKSNWQAGLTAAFSAGSFEKGLQRSGKQGWINGIQQKGEANYTQGVGAAASASKYSTNSGRFDAARGAAASSPRGPKGSPGNLQRVALVANAEHAAKVGK